jgi:hypothetical protein
MGTCPEPGNSSHAGKAAETEVMKFLKCQLESSIFMPNKLS